jgi:hypothetical protein
MPSPFRVDHLNLLRVAVHLTFASPRPHLAAHYNTVSNI